MFQLFALVLRNADKSTVRPFIPCSARHFFGKGLNLPAPLDIQWPKCFQLPGGADQGLCPWAPLGALPPDPRYRLVLCTRHGVPPTTHPSNRRLWSSRLEPPSHLFWQVYAYALLYQTTHQRQATAVCELYRIIWWNDCKSVNSNIPVISEVTNVRRLYYSRKSI